MLLLASTRVAERESVGEAARKVLKQAATLLQPGILFPDVTFTEVGKSRPRGGGRECTSCCPACTGSKQGRVGSGAGASGSLSAASGGVEGAGSGDEGRAVLAHCSTAGVASGAGDGSGGVAAAGTANAAVTAPESCVAEASSGKELDFSNALAASVCVVQRGSGERAVVDGSGGGNKDVMGRRVEAAGVAVQNGINGREDHGGAQQEHSNEECETHAFPRASDQAAEGGGGTSQAQGISTGVSVKEMDQECTCCPLLCLLLVPPQAQVRDGSCGAAQSPDPCWLHGSHSSLHIDRPPLPSLNPLHPDDLAVTQGLKTNSASPNA